MHKARLVAADMFGQMGEKGDHVMFGHGLDFVDAGHVKGDILGLPDRLGIGARDNADIGHRVAGMGLDLVPDAEFGFGRPDGDHVGAGIAGNHRRSLQIAVKTGFVALVVRQAVRGNPSLLRQSVRACCLGVRARIDLAKFAS